MAERHGNGLAEALTHYTDRQVGQSPFITAIEGLTILRSDHERAPTHTIIRPALCVVAQGEKWSTFGKQRFEYKAGQALVVGIEMPSVGRIVAASPREPFLGTVIEFTPAIMRDVMEHMDAPLKTNGTVGRGVFVTDFEGPLADCVLRLIRLLDTPDAIPALHPLIMREICYWLLAGPRGGDIAGMTLANSYAQRVIGAIHCLRARFTEAIRIDELAAIAQMSPSAFHRQFKALTSITPLQYQKQLRLLEARRLIVSKDVNIETAAFEVGYESPSQFSREYSRMFGAPPRRDIRKLGGAPALA